MAQGRLGEAEAALTRAYLAAQEWGNRVHRANVRATQARVAIARHDAAQARALLAEAHGLFGSVVDPFVRDKIARVGAELIERDVSRDLGQTPSIYLL